MNLNKNMFYLRSKQVKDVKIKEFRHVLDLKQKNENGHRLVLFFWEKVILFFVEQ